MDILDTAVKLQQERTLSGRYCLQVVGGRNVNPEGSVQDEIPIIMYFIGRGTKEFITLAFGTQYFIDIDKKVTFGRLGSVFTDQVSSLLITRLSDCNLPENITYVPLSSISNHFDLWSDNI